MNDFDQNSRQVAVQQEQSHLPSTFVRETMPYFEEDEVHLRDYIDVVLRRKWVVIITLLVVFSFIAVSTLSETPMYRARGTIKTSPKAKIATTLQNVDESYLKSQEFIATQMNLLQSDRLLGRIIKVMDLENDRSFSGEPGQTGNQGLLAGFKNTVSALKGIVRDLIRPQADTDPVMAANPEYIEQVTLERNLKKIKKGLGISPVKNTQLLEISYASANAKLAAKMVNTLMQQFLEISMEGRLSSFQSAGIFLDKQIEKAKIKLEKSEKELNQFARRTGIISLDSRLNLIMRQLEEVNAALSEAVTVRIAKESMYRQTQKTGGENLPAVMDNELLQELKSEYNALLSEYQVLSTTFKDEYPKIKEIKAKMQDLYNRYTLEQKRIIDSIRLEYEAALDNEKRLTEKAESQKQLAIELNDKATQYKILEREVSSNKEVYNSLLSRSKEISASVGSGGGNLEIIDTARPPLSPYKPNVRRRLLMGIMLGMFGGIGLAFLLEYMDNTVKNPEEFTKRYRIPVLGLIPYTHHELEEDRELAFMFYNDPKAPLSEAIRTTMFSIELSSSETPPKTMVLTSVLPDVGKSTLSCNFCLSLLTSGARVLLIDTDLRKPTLHQLFDITDNSRGLSSFLAGSVDIKEVMRKTQFENLYFIPSGPIPPNPAELLASSRMRSFITTAAEKFDYIIIDTPPFHGFAEILIMSNMVDGVILVSELSKTPRDGIEYFKKAVTNVGGKILGVLVNKAGRGGKGYRYYGGYRYQNYYNYEYGTQAE
jgi:capsular exopolysaccharide synthesis family protein